MDVVLTFIVAQVLIYPVMYTHYTAMEWLIWNGMGNLEWNALAMTYLKVCMPTQHEYVHLPGCKDAAM